jgi:2-polyprenyl-3-methyl-5-hydroxy-6-metoxy-1,4-benzoquinol methylase
MTQSTTYYQNQRNELAVLLPEHVEHVLEIGCGHGNFRSNVKTDCEYWGVEPFEEAARAAARQLDKVLAGSLDEVFTSLPDAYFDLVICNDVIEHMPDHDHFFSRIKTKMRRDSFLVGSIPNVRYVSNLARLLFLRDWPYAESGVLDRTHLRFFTERSLRRTLQQHGYVIDELRRINPIDINRGSLRGFCASVGMQLLVPVLGSDTRYLQFGFRVSPAH